MKTICFRMLINVFKKSVSNAQTMLNFGIWCSFPLTHTSRQWFPIIWYSLYCHCCYVKLILLWEWMWCKIVHSMSEGVEMCVIFVVGEKYMHKQETHLFTHGLWSYLFYLFPWTKGATTGVTSVVIIPRLVHTGCCQMIK